MEREMAGEREDDTEADGKFDIDANAEARALELAQLE